MHYYRVRLWAEHQNLAPVLLTDVELWAESVEDAQKKVYEDFWDARLDASDCSPRYEVWPVDKNTGETIDG